jgi:DNA polymerase III sliding clamp (beta) subunit (PCNA family)
VKATVSTGELRDAVQSVRKVVPANATLPALRHILLDMSEGRLQVIGTNLQNTIIVEIPAIGEGCGQVVAPGRELGEMLAAMAEG